MTFTNASLDFTLSDLERSKVCSLRSSIQIFYPTKLAELSHMLLLNTTRMPHVESSGTIRFGLMDLKWSKSMPLKVTKPSNSRGIRAPVNNYGFISID